MSREKGKVKTVQSQWDRQSRLRDDVVGSQYLANTFQIGRSEISIPGAKATVATNVSPVSLAGRERA